METICEIFPDRHKKKLERNFQDPAEKNRNQNDEKQKSRSNDKV